jgi:hypothetical protein
MVDGLSVPGKIASTSFVRIANPFLRMIASPSLVLDCLSLPCVGLPLRPLGGLPLRPLCWIASPSLGRIHSPFLGMIASLSLGMIPLRTLGELPVRHYGGLSLRPWEDCLYIICEDCLPVPWDDYICVSPPLERKAYSSHVLCSPLFPRVSGSFLILWEAASLSPCENISFLTIGPPFLEIFLFVYNKSCLCAILYMYMVHRSFSH